MKQGTSRTRSHQAGYRTRRTPVALLGALLIAVAWLMAMPDHAAASTVATCDEAGLRAAIGTAAPGDTITFECSGTVTLTATGGGPISIDKNLTIDGSGQSVTISGGGSVGVVEISTGVTVMLKGLTISNGHSDVGGYGGVLNNGTLTVVDSIFSANVGGEFGAGGIRTHGPLTVANSTFTGNTGISGVDIGSPGTAGAIYASLAIVDIANSSFSNNAASGRSSAGGIYSAGALVSVTASTFSGNWGATVGGIYSYSGSLGVTNSTFSGNAAAYWQDGGDAGAIFTAGFGAASVTNSTLTGNTAVCDSLCSPGHGAGGIFTSLDSFRTVTLTNTILAGNLSVGSLGITTPTNCGPLAVVDNGGNFSDSTCAAGFTQTSSVALNLAPLADNGGPTQTIALGTGSAAIDAGSCLPATDQRGFPRPGAGSTLCDSGAFELQSDTAPAQQAITFTSTAPADAVYGGTYQVSATGGNSGIPVVFTIDASSIGVCSVTSATVSFTGVGTCTVTASQAGNNNYKPAADVDQSFAIAKATLTVTASSHTITFGGLAPTVSPSYLGFVGTDDASNLDTPPTCSTTYTQGADAGGSYSTSCSGGLDDNYQFSFVDGTVTVEKATQAPLTILTPTDATYGAAEILTVSGGTTGGAVTYNAGASTGCSVAGDQLTVTDATGSCSVTATMAGNTNYLPVISAAHSVTLHRADTTTTVTCPLSVVYDGAAQEPCSANVTGPGNLDESVTVTYLNNVNPGTATASASYLGSANYNPCDDSASFEILHQTAPVVTSMMLTPSPVAVGADSTLEATVSDGGSEIDLVRYSTDGGSTWTDINGFTPAPTVSVTGILSNLPAGVHEVCLVGTDAAGTTSEPRCVFLVVYDPNGGFVTGGGWINSPLGACRLSTVCETITGKANFGFNAKYKKGSNVPDGQTQFQFSAGGLNFHSSAYDAGSLVVAGAKAIFKGTGTINGTDSYGFMLTAIDGQVNGGGGTDELRMKIWRLSDGVVVYDNQMAAPENADPTTVLSGGSIVIHTPKK